MPIYKDTYEYKKVVRKPALDINNVELGICTKKVLTTELTKPFNGRFYHTNDTNEFFFDWGNKRYQLNLFGGGGSIDLKDYAKKSDLPTKNSQLQNDSGFITYTNLSTFLKENNYITKEDLEKSVSQFVKLTDFNVLKEELAQLKERVNEIKEQIGGDSEVADITTRIEVLEDAIIHRKSGDIVISDDPVLVGTGIRIEKGTEGSESEETYPSVYVFQDGTEIRLLNEIDASEISKEWDEFERE